MKRSKRFYIVERYNPQLGTYWIPCGQLSKAAAKRKGDTLYGYNTVHGFDTQQAYNNRLAVLKLNGENLDLNRI